MELSGVLFCARCRQAMVWMVFKAISGSCCIQLPMISPRRRSLPCSGPVGRVFANPIAAVEILLRPLEADFVQRLRSRRPLRHLLRVSHGAGHVILRPRHSVDGIDEHFAARSRWRAVSAQDKAALVIPFPPTQCTMV